MQIHEVTRRHLKELNAPLATGTGAVKPTVTYGPGFAKPAVSSGAQPVAATATPPRTSGSIGSTGVPGGGLANVVGGTLGALGKSLMSKAFGGVDVTGKFSGGAMDRAQALKLGQDMAKTLMPVLQQNWSQKVQAALAQSIDPTTRAAPTSPAKLTSGEQSRLRAELVTMVNQSINPRSNFDYKTLANYVGDDTTPEGQTIRAQAMQSIQDITQSIDGIFKATIAGGNPAQDWQHLVINGIAPAQGVLAFDTGTGAGYGGAGGRRATLSAQDQALAAQLGLNATDIAELQMAARNPTQKAQLLKMLGIQQ